MDRRYIPGQQFINLGFFQQEHDARCSGIATKHSMPRIPQPCYPVRNASDFAFGAIMEHMGRLYTYASSELSGPRAILGMAPKQVLDRVLEFHPLHVRNAHVTPPGIHSIAVRSRTAAIEGTVRHIDKRAIAPVLIHP